MNAKRREGEDSDQNKVPLFDLYSNLKARHVFGTDAGEFRHKCRY